MLPRNKITNPLPFPLSGRPSSQAAIYQDAHNNYDYALGGIPFLSAISNKDVALRRTATYRKTQFDNTTEPGEQTLTGWWLRSQSSWHFGTGLVYEDPALDDSSKFRFADSEGVNPWAEGQLTLLPDTTQRTSGPPSAPLLMVGAAVGATDAVAWAAGGIAGWASATSTFAVTFASSPAGNCLAMATDGAAIYYAFASGLWMLPIPNSLAAGTATKLWAWTCTRACLGWCMGRLMAGLDTALYALVPPGGSIPYSLPTAVYTSLVSSWTWTSITAGPSKIYCSGYAGNRGSILAVGLDNTGLLPTLAGATEVAQLPTGEWPLAVRSYLGTFLAIGTNRGVRIATVDDSGDVQYGPLIATPSPVYDFVSVDRFVYAAYTGGFKDGSSGLIRIDLSAVLPNNNYPYAKDLKVAAQNATLRSIALIGNSNMLAVGLDGEGVWFQSSTAVVATGYLLTARIRYDTTWPKLYKALSLRGLIPGGCELGVSTIDQTGGETSIVTIGSQTGLDDDFAINYPDGPQVYVSLRFTLERDPGNILASPTVTGYALKALPAGPRPRQFVIPVQCYDREKNKAGKSLGYPGYGIQRLLAVEQLDTSGSVVAFQDLRSGDTMMVQITQIEFRQEMPPGTKSEMWGGVLNLVLQSLA